MDCKFARSLVDLCVDNELGLDRIVELEHHLAGCVECSGAVHAARRLNAGIGEMLPRYRPAGNLQGRLFRAVASSAAPDLRMRKPGALSRPLARAVALSAAAALLLLLIGFTAAGFLATRSSVQDAVADEVLSGHLRSLMANHLADVASTNRHTVKPWFAGRLDFSPPVVDLAADGFPLVAGRLDYLEDQPVAAIVYRRNRHVINLFVWPGASAKTPGTKGPPEALLRRGYNLLHWTDSEMNFWAVSDVSAVDMRNFAAAYRRQSRL